ncbi:DNA polymerase I [Alloscardovia theropitheci]|uniref:DNA polymerase I n=1 Tax=Alloscardovia theropitheci TaxID=2496842 RepID=A0A4R0QQK0_9BIFI|nr:DNA polymerase I [Alloscardovia theropitheci]TCD54593.1 DNA polymerase I [Alloscardovia theropitheci]
MVSRLLVIDGHSLAFRAYFALPADGFSTSQGQTTNAVYGFTTMLTQVLNEIQPTHIAVAFDVKGGTFRNELLPQYKGTRDAAPEDLLSQLPLLHDLLDSLDISYVERQGYEGDDIIATLATLGRDSGFDQSYVLSGDRDAFQLVDEKITVLYPGQHFKDLKHMTPEAIFEKYGVYPQQYPDLAALRGETADNIPGVPGVGDGFAAKWINQFGGLEGIIEHADEIKGKKGEALRENIEQVKLNRKVNALVRNVDLGVSLDEFEIHPPAVDKVDKALSAFEFGAGIKKRVYAALAQCSGDRNLNTESVNFTSARKNSQSASAASDADDMDASAGSNAQELVNSAHIETIVDTNVSLEGAIKALQAWENELGQQVWALHIEGRVKPALSHLTRLTFVSYTGSSVSLPARVCAEGNADIRKNIQLILHDHADKLVLHNYKRALHILKSINIEVPEPAMDTQLAAYLLKPDADDYQLNQLAHDDAHIDMGDDNSNSLQDTNIQGSFDFDVESDQDSENEAELSLTSARTGMSILALNEIYTATLSQREEMKLLKTIEIPVSRVLFELEDAGALVDQSRLASMLDTFTADAQQAQNIAWEQAGEKINLQSPKQLQAVLFDDMGLPPTKKTKSGGYTTNAAALQDLYIRSAYNERANTFLGALLRHREINKLKQIVQSLTDSVYAHDGRIHTTFEQTVAATGRLSSTEPNLQNIPNRNAQGREIRSAFVPSAHNEALLSADYSQVELRLMAHLSGDEALIEAFKSGTDFHRYVASLVYGIAMEDVSPDQRSHIKAMSYGLAYGLSTYGLAQQLKISPAESDILRNKYFDTFGKVHDYLESLVADAKRKGYTETMFGRRRYFPGLRSSNRQMRDAAERAALNAPIQGSAADIMKIAMINADKALKNADVKSHVILQIHDELVVDVAAGEADIVSNLVKDAMEHAVELAVPLDVSTGLGSDWQQAAH